MLLLLLLLLLLIIIMIITIMIITQMIIMIMIIIDAPCAAPPHIPSPASFRSASRLTPPGRYPKQERRWRQCLELGEQGMGDVLGWGRSSTSLLRFTARLQDKVALSTR